MKKLLTIVILIFTVSIGYSQKTFNIIGIKYSNNVQKLDWEQVSGQMIFNDATIHLYYMDNAIIRLRLETEIDHIEDGIEILEYKGFFQNPDGTFNCDIEMAFVNDFVFITFSFYDEQESILTFLLK